jgi:hypothetical protein
MTTKVLLEGERIADTARICRAATRDRVFRLDQRFRIAMERAASQGREGISDGVRELIQSAGFGTVALPAGSQWLDIDTPDAYRHALARRATFA